MKFNKLILLPVFIGLIYNSLYSRGIYYTIPAVVENVIDGDTITVKTGSGRKKVRLNYIDAMESKKNSKLSRDFIGLKHKGLVMTKKQMLELGRKAKYVLKSILKKGDEIKLKINKSKEIDKYNRLLAEIYFKNRNLNVYLVQKGLACKYFMSSAPFPVKKMYGYAENEAKAKRTGIWKYMKH